MLKLLQTVVAVAIAASGNFFTAESPLTKCAKNIRSLSQKNAVERSYGALVGQSSCTDESCVLDYRQVNTSGLETACSDQKGRLLFYDYTEVCTIGSSVNDTDSSVASAAAVVTTTQVYREPLCVDTRTCDGSVVELQSLVNGTDDCNIVVQIVSEASDGQGRSKPWRIVTAVLLTMGGIVAFLVIGYCVCAG